jgi:N-acyl-L-homoserine lactone synthetase
MSSAEQQKLSCETHEPLICRAVAALSQNISLPWAPIHWQDLCFEVLTDRTDLLESFQLRYRAYSEYEYISAADFPRGLEVDSFDDRAIHFIARRESSRKIVGYTRLLMGNPVQMEEMLNIADYRRRYGDRICEMSRLIVYPKGQRYVGRGLRKAAFRWAEETGIACIVGISRACEEKVFTRLNILPMEPRRRCQYFGSHFKLLVGTWLYGNYFDVGRNSLYIQNLLEPRFKPRAET